jgi:hypothetical protein
VNLSDEIIRNAIAMAFNVAGGLMILMIPAVLLMWADVRSLKKSANSAFRKIRDLEKKVFGHETSEGDK